MSNRTLLSLYTEHNNKLLNENRRVIMETIPGSVERYYQLLLSREETAKFLSNELVEKRLQSALATWLEFSLTSKTHEELTDLNTRNVQIGKVHARINVSMSLVSEAMIVLKNSFYTDLCEQQPNNEVILIVLNILDYALITINESYFQDYESIGHQSNVLHNHLSSIDFALEIEQMRANIHQWYATCLTKRHFPPIIETSYSLWIRHKLPLAIADAQRSETIENLLTELHSNCKTADFNKEETITPINQSLNGISWHLAEISKSLVNAAEKKDSLTRLYNRRFLNTILLQETMLAQKTQYHYSVAMLDVDNFKKINDAYGHSTGDEVLIHIGELINLHTRVSDFGFRYGGEEFLILLTECSQNKAVEIIQKIASELNKIEFKSIDGDDFKVTFSAGVAAYDNQPDYQHTIQKADKALYQSKDNGKNRITIWQ
jgi:diguanylate cyclase